MRLDRRGLVGLALVLHGTTSIAHVVQAPLASLDNEQQGPISIALFSSMERMSRLVDIAYCVGNTGVSEPFDCVSRCKEFPTLTLSRTWNTGILLSDSCGYIAVDHGIRRPDLGEEDEEDHQLGEKAIVVAFRGTYSIANTVVDLSTVPQQYVSYPSPDDGGESPEEPRHRCDNCTVHGGFLESWRQARKIVLPELKTLKETYPDYPLQLVGHSLGGAVAMLAALELRVSLGWHDVLVTTFGEPKVGNQELCDYVDTVFTMDDGDGGRDAGSDPEKRTYRRVTHAEDPVPLLPLTEWGYRSHGGEFFIAKKELSPSLEDVVVCRGADDRSCIGSGDVHPEDLEERVVQTLAEEAQSETESEVATGEDPSSAQDIRLTKRLPSVPARYKLWQLFFAHRDYFWRLGLCVPGGDPANWGREKYPGVSPSESALREEL